ncbi:MAG TPA: recombinase RecT [Myxococcaceae bacterium]|nr:recombinase RecT [Myxococcaceae bacterium]
MIHTPPDQGPGTALALAPQGQLVQQARPVALSSSFRPFSTEEILIIRDTINPDLSPADLSLFVRVCERQHLDVFSQHICAVMRTTDGKKRMVIQIQIGGLRVRSERTGRYAGRIGPLWCGPDLVWHEVWPDPVNPPFAAKAAVVKLMPDGKPYETWNSSRFQSFAQKKADGSLTKMWLTMGDHMIGKVAEAGAHRAAFPEENGGLYVPEELAGADLSSTDGLYKPRTAEDVARLSQIEDAARSTTITGARADGGVSAAVAAAGLSPQQQERAELERLYALMPPPPKGWAKPMFDAWATRKPQGGKSGYELAREAMIAKLEELGIPWAPKEPQASDAEGDGAGASEPGEGGTAAEAGAEVSEADQEIADAVDEGLRQEDARQVGLKL